ncbi:hypothetical protein MTP99_008395 [Tenebrio molitor]|nr:hypothetical protein MTP99_008395 [Tenebrio molitor]
MGSGLAETSIFFGFVAKWRERDRVFRVAGFPSGGHLRRSKFSFPGSVLRERLNNNKQHAAPSPVCNPRAHPTVISARRNLEYLQISRLDYTSF